jgi:TRAP-type C4-dicarboxylate transport system permease small subunit
MRLLSLALDRLERIAIWLANLLLVLMAALMNVEIISRYVFGRSTQIADEYAGYFFTAVTLLCFVPAMRRGRFIRVMFVVDRFPRALRLAMDAVASLIGAAVSAVFAWTTFQLAWGSFVIGSTALQAIQTPLFIPQSVMPLGFALLTLAFLERGLAASLGHEPARVADPLEITHGLD